MSALSLISLTQQWFEQCFGYAAPLLIQAPGRVNLIGEHTDYNDGFVLPCAINYQTVISAGPREDRKIRVMAVDYAQQIDEFSLNDDITPHPDWQWANYVRGVIKFLQQRNPAFGGADLVISGNVPQGAGLSSSASLEVAVGQAMKGLYQMDISQTELALNGQQAENQFVGCNCGIMDQFISALGEPGQALLIDCRSLDTRAVPLPAGVDVLIVNSNVRRGLVGSEYNRRREQCETAARHFGVKALRDLSLAEFQARETELDPLVAKRARHVITENARTLAAADALAAGDLAQMGRLMAASHASMRDDFQITVPPIDTLVDLIQQQIGPHGGVRMTGGGFGGCVVALLPQALTSQVCAAVEQTYHAKTGLQASIYICQASAGAGILPKEGQ